MKYSIKKKLIGGLSLTTALFVFQACYGTPQDFTDGDEIHGVVLDKITMEPIKGIQVVLNEDVDITNSEGKFWFYTELDSTYTLSFVDKDSVINKEYKNFDTTFTQANGTTQLQVLLEEK